MSGLPIKVRFGGLSSVSPAHQLMCLRTRHIERQVDVLDRIIQSKVFKSTEQEVAPETGEGSNKIIGSRSHRRIRGARSTTTEFDILLSAFALSNCWYENPYVSLLKKSRMTTIPTG